MIEEYFTFNEKQKKVIGEYRNEGKVDCQITINLIDYPIDIMENIGMGFLFDPDFDDDKTLNEFLDWISKELIVFTEFVQQQMEEINKELMEEDGVSYLDFEEADLKNLTMGCSSYSKDKEVHFKYMPSSLKMEDKIYNKICVPIGVNGLDEIREEMENNKTKTALYDLIENIKKAGSKK